MMKSGVKRYSPPIVTHPDFSGTLDEINCFTEVLLKLKKIILIFCGCCEDNNCVVSVCAFFPSLFSYL